MAENLFFENLFSGLNLKPKMLNQYPDQNSFMEYAKQKLADAYATGSADRVEAVDKALAGRLRNYGLLSEYENERQAVLDRARQYGQERKEREQAAYEQANAERLANFKGMMAGPIANIREVGPAGYQPGYQGGMDFADLQGMVPPPPTNKASSIVDASLDTGQQIARDQNRASTQGFFSDAREGVSSLLGGLGEALSSPFAQRLLAIMARPEFQDPRGISAGIVGAAAGLKQDEAAAAKVRREEQRLANEAAQQEFLNKLRIAEARRGERSLELKEEEAVRVTPKPIEATKEQIKLTKSLIDDVPIAKQYIDNQSGILGIGKDRIKESVVIEALAIRAQSGNQLNIRQSVEKAIQNRTGATSQDTAVTPNARLNVTQER